jgi:hypothetical protein
MPPNLEKQTTGEKRNKLPAQHSGDKPKFRKTNYSSKPHTTRDSRIQ